jgi:hypothetical protein
MNVEFSTGRMQRKKTELNLAQGQTGQPRSVAASHTLPPKILYFCQKFPYKSLNSLLPLILKIWKEKKFGKGNPILKITVLLWSNKHVGRGANHTNSTTTFNFNF